MAKVIRWTARVISVLTLLFFGIFIIGYAVQGEVPGLFTAVALAMILVGLILAWKWEAVGGFLVIIGYFFSVFLSPRIWSAWPYVICLITGLLFLFSWFHHKRSAQ